MTFLLASHWVRRNHEWLPKPPSGGSLLSRRRSGAACAVNLQMTRGKRALSIQSWAIAPKIREVNEYLAARTVRLPLVREMHPKLCFWALNGARPLSHKKQSKKGYEERIDLLSRHQADPAKVVTTVRREHGLDLVQRDDVVDALVGAVTAWLGRESLKTLPEKPEHDSAGLPMEMVYFPLNTERVVHVPALQEPLAPSKEAVVTEQPKPNLRGSPPQRGGSLGTTRPGYLNRNGQEVIRSTGKPGTDHGQYVYVLRCRACGREYGANGSDIFQRKCPGCQRGAPGLAD